MIFNKYDSSQFKLKVLIMKIAKYNFKLYIHIYECCSYSATTCLTLIKSFHLGPIRDTDSWTTVLVFLGCLLVVSLRASLSSCCRFISLGTWPLSKMFSFHCQLPTGKVWSHKEDSHKGVRSPRQTP